MSFGANDTFPYVQVGSSGLFLFHVGLDLMPSVTLPAGRCLGRQRNMRKQSISLIGLVAAFCVLAAACGSSSEVSTGGTNSVEALGDGPAGDQGECDRDELSGEWLSPSAAGTEPLAEDGSGVVVLNLSDGDVSLLTADSLEVADSWICTGSTIIGVTSEGEERELATINNDGTLRANGETLSKG